MEMAFEKTYLWHLRFLGHVLLCSVWFCPRQKSLCHLREVDMCDQVGHGVREDGEGTGHRPCCHHHRAMMTAGSLVFPGRLLVWCCLWGCCLPQCACSGQTHPLSHWWWGRGGEKLNCGGAWLLRGQYFPFRTFQRAHLFCFSLSFPFWAPPLSVCSVYGRQALALAGHRHTSYNSQLDALLWDFESRVSSAERKDVRSVWEERHSSVHLTPVIRRLGWPGDPLGSQWPFVLHSLFGPRPALSPGGVWGRAPLFPRLP